MPRGIFSSEDHTPENKLADFSYAPNDALAQMIVNAWVDKGFRDLLLKDSDNAKTLFAAAGFYWHGTARKPVVITEKQYNDGYTSDDDEIVFVLPQHDGKCPPGKDLLDTAKLLMGCTPNGI